ncbi:hypothetical protein HGM15179_014490 [Zosterops borbonicus]|uniref:Uncharacterized protein n=1 Tax=Zosterops borbonicus TaxID=364589 RepID=A0A8K1G676_9PASS|nr:hypothetical protein HGM15179_014490 [Zosterops borbonicus]
MMIDTQEDKEAKSSRDGLKLCTPKLAGAFGVEEDEAKCQDPGFLSKGDAQDGVKELAKSCEGICSGKHLVLLLGWAQLSLAVICAVPCKGWFRCSAAVAGSSGIVAQFPLTSARLEEQEDEAVT